MLHDRILDNVYYLLLEYRLYHLIAYWIIAKKLVNCITDTHKKDNSYHLYPKVDTPLFAY